MSIMLEPIVQFYRNILSPVQPFSDWVGMPISMLDLGAAFRLCLVMRQVREQLHAKHVENAAKPGKAGVSNVEPRSFVREAATTLLVVYGGEAVICECA
jgi:hypothetical protein